MTTLIQVSDELWEYLNSHKDRNTKTFEDVIWRFIREDDKNEETNI